MHSTIRQVLPTVEGADIYDKMPPLESSPETGETARDDLCTLDERSDVLHLLDQRPIDSYHNILIISVRISLILNMMYGCVGLLCRHQLPRA